MNVQHTSATGFGRRRGALVTAAVLAASLTSGIAVAGPAAARIAPSPGAPAKPPVAAKPVAAKPVTAKPATKTVTKTVAKTVAAAAIRPLAKAQPRAASAVAIHIPRLGIDKTMVRLHVQKNRSLTVPKSFSAVGWWSEGPKPAAQGAVIVGGHISSKAGPGAFYRLNSMRVGDLVSVDRSDGTTAVFQVRTKKSYPRKNYPNGIVYRTTGKASIHLITCDGAFDSSIGHHVNNLVVFADLVSTHRTGRV